ncbi:MAG: ABC transporter substrate-binding protein [Chloroflexi bacterium]|nr:ABC transporter substrate-binding protein [Chloroflexota bacterium]
MRSARARSTDEKAARAAGARPPWRALALASMLSAMVLASACAEEADKASEDRTGVSETEIVLGTHFPLSQHLAAAYAPIATAGMKGYFDYINDQGGINGRKIRFVVADDHYNPPDTAEVVRRLVEQDQVFAVVGGLGTATHSAAAAFLEERGVPDMFILSGASKFTDPVVKTRFGGNPDYITEAKILGGYIAKEHPDAKVALILQNDDFGADGEKGLKQGLEGSNVRVVSREPYESLENDLTSQVQRAKNSGADVLVAYTLPPQGANVVKVARQVLNWDVPIVVTGVDATGSFIDLAGAESAEGVVSVLFGKQAYQTSDPDVAAHVEIMDKYGGGAPPSNLTVVGQAMAEFTVEALQRAGQDLTRERFVEAAESLRGFRCSVCLVPISMSPTDHRPFEIEVFVQVREGKWVAFGEPVGFESTK